MLLLTTHDWYSLMQGCMLGNVRLSLEASIDPLDPYHESLRHITAAGDLSPSSIISPHQNDRLTTLHLRALNLLHRPWTS
jgi:hypothetical protein